MKLFNFLKEDTSALNLSTNRYTLLREKVDVSKLDKDEFF